MALIFDALMMGLAIIDRFNQLRHSRRLAMEESLAHAQRNLALGERLADQSAVDGSKPPQGGGEPDAANIGAPPDEGRPAEPGLHAVLHGIADMFRSEAAAKGLELRLVLAAPDAKVAAYPLMRVLANLVPMPSNIPARGKS